MTGARRAFTVVELVVALLVGVNVLLILWTVFSSDQRRFFGDQARLTALQGALLFQERLGHDLDRLAVRLPGTGPVPPGTYDLNAPVRIENQGTRLTFLIQDPDANTMQVPTREVTWQFDRNTSRVYRQSGGRTDMIRNLLAENLRFSLVALRTDPARLGAGPAPETFQADAPVHLVKFQLTSFSEALRDRPAAERRPEDRVTLAMALPLNGRSLRIHHPYWMPGGSETILAPAP